MASRTVVYKAEVGTTAMKGIVVTKVGWRGTEEVVDAQALCKKRE